MRTTTALFRKITLPSTSFTALAPTGSPRRLPDYRVELPAGILRADLPVITMTDPYNAHPHGFAQDLLTDAPRRIFD